MTARPKRVWARRLLRLVTVLVAIPFFYMVFGLVGGVLPGPVAALNGGAAVSIALARGPIHTDILLPLTDQIRADFAFAAAAGVPLDHPRARYLVVGWGARAFYTGTGSSADLSLGPLLRAVTGDSAVMRLDVAGDLTGLPGIRRLTISERQLAALSAGLRGALQVDAAGAPLRDPAPGFGLTDAFFAAKGRFNAFYTCNAWAGTQLRAAGIGGGLWTPSVDALLLGLALWGP